MRMTIFKVAMLVAIISLGATIQAQDYEGYIGGNFMLKAPMDAPKRYCTGMRGDHPEDTIGLQMVAFAKSLPDEQALLDVVAYINTLTTQ